MNFRTAKTYLECCLGPLWDLLLRHLLSVHGGGRGNGAVAAADRGVVDSAAAAALSGDHVLDVLDVPVVLVELPDRPLQVLWLLVLPVKQIDQCDISSPSFLKKSTKLCDTHF